MRVGIPNLSNIAIKPLHQPYYLIFEKSTISKNNNVIHLYPMSDT